MNPITQSNFFLGPAPWGPPGRSDPLDADSAVFIQPVRPAPGELLGMVCWV
jgi:hypothetical protein